MARRCFFFFFFFFFFNFTLGFCFFARLTSIVNPVAVSTPGGTGTEPGRCRFGLFEFDFGSGELRKDGIAVKLPPQPSRVLALLLARPGDVVLREELRRLLWGEDTFVDFERGLNFCILQVRGALGDSSENPRFVQTIPRKGYRFIAPLTVVGSISSTETAPALPLGPDVASTDAVQPTPRSGRRFRNKPHERYANAPSGQEPSHSSSCWPGSCGLPAPCGQPCRPQTPTTTLPMRSRVVVLPVVNLTGDAGADYLAGAA